jgi:hypothetical protein
MTKKKTMTADKELEQLLLSEDSLAQYHKMVEDLWNQAFKGKIDANTLRAKQEFEDKVLEVLSNATQDSITEVKPNQAGDFSPIEIKSTVTEEGIHIDTKVIEEEEESKEEQGNSLYADYIHENLIQMSKDGAKIEDLNQWIKETLNIDEMFTGGEEGSHLEKHKRYKEFILDSAINKILEGEKVDKVLKWLRERESISSEEKLSYVDKLEHVPSYAEEHPHSGKTPSDDMGKGVGEHFRSLFVESIKNDEKQRQTDTGGHVPLNEDVSKRFDKNVNKIFEEGKKRLEEYRKLQADAKLKENEERIWKKNKAETDELERKAAGEEVKDYSKEWEEYYKRDKAKNIHKPYFPEYTDVAALSHEEIEKAELKDRSDAEGDEIRVQGKKKAEKVKKILDGMAIEKPEFPKFKDWRNAAVEGSEEYTALMKDGKRLTMIVYKDRLKQNSGKIFRRLVMGVTLHFMALCYLIYDYFVGLGSVGEIVFQVMTYSSFAFYFMLALASYRGLEIQRKLEEVDRKYEGY